MTDPSVKIDVDPETGVWSTDGLPMIYVPRHFFVNNHKATEAALGIDKASEMLRGAGYDSAYYWCKVNAKEYDLEPVATFEHYLKRLSQRGWGLFVIDKLDTEAGTARIHVDNSVFVLEQGNAGRKVCKMFEGWIEGGLNYINDELSLGHHFQCQETQCVSNGDPQCLFEASVA